MAADACGSEHPERPGVRCIATTPHAAHVARTSSGTVGWPNAEFVVPATPQKGQGGRKPTRARGSSEVRRAAQALANTLGGVGQSWDNSVLANERIEPKKGTRRREVWNKLRAAGGDWVSGIELATAECGGSQGLKRVRELRLDLGWPIERRPDPGSETTWQYRLVIDQHETLDTLETTT